ncbi:hypothetical protein TRVL_07650 [Trypanosoma vivax]|nr:hypothetical protein TRVL_07650 [Trypanosoma vivax]
MHPLVQSSTRERRYIPPSVEQLQDFSASQQVSVSDNEAPVSFCSLVPCAPQSAPHRSRVENVPPPEADATAAPSAETKRGRTLYVRMFLPSPSSVGCPVLNSWRDLPPNPLMGSPGLVAEVSVRNCAQQRFHCDPCQRDFCSKEKYDQHMEGHIWCQVPGCSFSCAKTKEWKMEMHVEKLHNLPNAPDLADLDAYLRDRRKFFPTQESVMAKVEELLYKASRGTNLSVDDRRLLRRHGVTFWKRPREGVQPGASARAATQETPSQKPEDGSLNAHDQTSESVSGPVRAHEGTSSADGEADTEPLHRLERTRLKRMVPHLPNGTLTRAQRVQLMCERYREAPCALPFYVCNCCGEKGSHWAKDCPNKGNETFERQMVWGEERRDLPVRGQGCKTAALVESRCATSMDGDNLDNVTGCGEFPHSTEEKTAVSAVQALPSDTSIAGGDATSLMEIGDDSPPPERSARCLQGEEEKAVVREVTKILAPVAAARKACEGERGAKLKASRRRDPRRPVEPELTLYQRLTDDQRHVEHELLLQAIRFFVRRQFLASQ